jgi:hypothetical protein
MEREKVRMFSRNPIPWARIAAISDVIRRERLQIVARERLVVLAVRKMKRPERMAVMRQRDRKERFRLVAILLEQSGERGVLRLGDYQQQLVVHYPVGDRAGAEPPRRGNKFLVPGKTDRARR